MSTKPDDGGLMESQAPTGGLITDEYSVLSRGAKHWFLFMAAFAAMFSPMSNFVFYPAITSIAESLGTTVALVNIAITTYMLISAITPAILGDAADKLGRRPIYILALSIYVFANVGLALQSSYPALLVLRMIQSAGSSGTGFYILYTTGQRAYVYRNHIFRVWHRFRHC